MKKLFSSKSNEALSCINGIRAITITWIIIAHSLAWSDNKLFSNYKLSHIMFFK
jgi:hypothetical protein